MKTKITKEIDGYKIITGIGIAQIDPIASLNSGEKIYCGCRIGETHISDYTASQIISHLQTLSDRELLKDDLTIMRDLRGKTLYKKSNNHWNHRVIEVLNDDILPDEKLEEELTETEILEIRAQYEIDRIKTLSEEEKEKEKNEAKETVAMECAILKSKLEILDDPDALAKAQASYNDKILEIELKYS